MDVGRSVKRVGIALLPAHVVGLVGIAGRIVVVGFMVVCGDVGRGVATPEDELPTINSPSLPNLLRTIGRGGVDGADSGITDGGGLVSGVGVAVVTDTSFTVDPEPGMVLKLSFARNSSKYRVKSPVGSHREDNLAHSSGYSYFNRLIIFTAVIFCLSVHRMHFVLNASGSILFNAFPSGEHLCALIKQST